MADREIEYIADIVRVHGRRRPDKVAIAMGDRRTTYADLDRRTNLIANALLALGLPAQARIGILAANSDATFEVMFGAIKANMRFCPINARLAPPEISFVINDAKMTILFVDAEFAATIAALRPELEGLSHVVAINPEAGFPHTYGGWLDGISEVDPGTSIAFEDVAFQLYTSGTTGSPKGVEISHGGLYEMRKIETALPGSESRWRENDVALVSMPLFHVSGSFWALIWLYRGATCVIQQRVNASEIIVAIADYGITQLFVVPIVLKMMLDDPLIRHAALSSLKAITYGGSPISPELLRQAIHVFGCDFIQNYGMTETSGVVAQLSPTDHDLSRTGLLKSCGRPFPLVDFKIADERGAELPVGAIGEIIIRTPSLMKGYWNRPGDGAGHMHGEWYRSGDAGYRDADGYFYLVDRVKDMIVTGAENVYPIEIENALLEHPAIEDAAVIGVPDEKWGEAVKAVLVAKGPAPPFEELKAFLRQRIAGYKIPKSFDFRSTLPRNASGKILKRKLREEYWKGCERRLN